MKCQILFYGENKKSHINLSSVHSVVSNNSQMSVQKKKLYKIML